MTEQKRNPINTLDDAVMWLAANQGVVSFWKRMDGSTNVQVDNGEAEVEREIGEGGYDARGTLMMATRELWEIVNG